MSHESAHHEGVSPRRAPGHLYVGAARGSRPHSLVDVRRHLHLRHPCGVLQRHERPRDARSGLLLRPARESPSHGAGPRGGHGPHRSLHAGVHRPARTTRHQRYRRRAGACGLCGEPLPRRARLCALRPVQRRVLPAVLSKPPESGRALRPRLHSGCACHRPAGGTPLSALGVLLRP